MHKIITQIILSISILSNVYADNIINGSVSLNSVNEDSIVINGSAKLSDSNFNNLVVNGSLQFHNLKIDHHFQINGSMKGNALIVDNANINGSFDAKNITVKHDIIVNGPLSSNKIKVEGKTTANGLVDVSDGLFQDMEIDAKKVILKNTGANNIIFTTTTGNQELHLKGYGVVAGDIEFKSGNGEVIIHGKIEIKGKVTGGKIIHAKL